MWKMITVVQESEGGGLRGDGIRPLGSEIAPREICKTAHGTYKDAQDHEQRFIRTCATAPCFIAGLDLPCFAFAVEPSP